MSVVSSEQQVHAGEERSRGRRYGVLSRITCPHCWHRFNPEQILWVAEHLELVGDAVLGPEQQQRFLPSRFNAKRQALDAKGAPCRTLACPRCHLVIPRALIESEPVFLSIVGGPASGKSYFLAAMTWGLRKSLAQDFDLVFNDADTMANRHLNYYEEKLFLADDPAEPVYLEKTELEGSLYEQVSLDGQPTLLPRPFLFSLRPSPAHPNGKRIETLGRVVCLYDNAGEHFLPGNDSATRPGTQHLGKSRALMFLFDPTQDSRFREQCRQFSADPQLVGKARTQRQETLLTEASQRIRRYTNLAPNKKFSRPLLVLVSKSDVWGPMFGEDVQTEPVVPRDVKAGRPRGLFNIREVERVSAKLREFLFKWTPEFVATAEDFCETVLYIPVSALGGSPAPLTGGGLGISPRNIRPRWVTVPLLYTLSKWSAGYVGVIR